MILPPKYNTLSLKVIDSQIKKNLHQLINIINCPKYQELKEVHLLDLVKKFNLVNKENIHHRLQNIKFQDNFKALLKKDLLWACQEKYLIFKKQEVKFNDMFKTKMNNNFPQPASYSIKIPQIQKKITIGQRFSQKKKWIDFVPGPGNYNHLSPTSNLTSTLSNFRTAPGTRFGKTERLKEIKQTRLKSPGPGNYQSNITTIKKLGTTFGKAERTQSVNKTLSLCPGPGAYNMFSSFLH